MNNNLKGPKDALPKKITGGNPSHNFIDIWNKTWFLKNYIDMPQTLINSKHLTHEAILEIILKAVNNFHIFHHSQAVLILKNVKSSELFEWYRLAIISGIDAIGIMYTSKRANIKTSLCLAEFYLKHKIQKEIEDLHEDIKTFVNTQKE